ncbi:ribonuclease HII [Croceivirga thetidis]|uniref:Ribonuclease HII n=1 Tax=Croceivirga thetidis TaxID=2721623 RepID=A0ABX1GPJ7_9FLAO|nr:ribonuclease HII [Croceivirga thetidis]NKI31853.1 ribonuclease HII [Croceivirga thetidis]
MRFRILLLLVLFLACKQEEKATQNLLGYLPENPVLIIKINQLNNLKTELNNSLFLQQINKTEIYTSISEKINPLGQFELEDLSVIGFYEVGKNNLEFALASKDLNAINNVDEVANRKVETITYENKTITKITLENSTYYSTSINKVDLLASSQLLIENLIRSEVPVAVSQSLNTLYNASGEEKSASIFLNFKESRALTSSITNPKGPFSFENFGDWLALDISNQNNNLHFSGVAVANDSVKNFLNLFRGTIPGPESIASIAPRNVDGLVSFRIADFSIFSQNRKEYLDISKEQDTLLNTIDEIGIFTIANETTVALKSFGPNNLTEFLLNNSDKVSDYQGYDIRSLNQKDFLTNQLSPLVTGFSSNFYTLIENNFIFSENEELLKNVVANKNSGTTFSTSPGYLNAREFLPFESSLFFTSKKGGIPNFLSKYLAQDVITDLASTQTNDFIIAGQIGIDGEIFHSQLILNKVGVQRAAENVSPLLTVELDTDIAFNPQFVKNHRNNNYEIIVQDRDKNLYLIDAKGKILWKKQLDGLIRGKIHQVDLYRNGRLQMAFCTNNRFMVLDRNGEITKGIDKKYDGGNLNGLAVFDYENNRKYRMVVTQGRKVFMYDNDGKTVDAFSYKEAESPVIKPPKHFRIGGKDYLTFLLEDGKLKIRHRAGGDRIKVNRNIQFSDNDVYLYLNKFSVTDKKGVLHQVGTNGKLSATPYNLNENHGMFATSKSLALMNENILNIKGKKIELELGVYSKPKIFYLYDKIYVAVTDIQNQKIYLFDSQAESIPNFPVYGSSAIDLIDVDGDKKLELVAKDQENSIILYGIN